MSINNRYSLTEIETLCKKATRGAGYHWGLAEEAGKGVRLLSGYGLSGAELLARLLVSNDKISYAEIRPISTEGTWHANRGTLCPIIAGATVSDRAHHMAGSTIELGQTSCPLLLIYSALLVSVQHKNPVHIEWSGVSIICTADHIALQGAEVDLYAVDTNHIKISMDEEQNNTDYQINYFSPLARPIDPDCLNTLEDFAYRTYAPATEISRAGAGEGK